MCLLLVLNKGNNADRQIPAQIMRAECTIHSPGLAILFPLSSGGNANTQKATVDLWTYDFSSSHHAHYIGQHSLLLLEVD